MTERILTNDKIKGEWPHDCGSIMRMEENRECEICRVCKKVICYSNHCHDDTDEIELIICEDCLKKGIEVVNE